MFCRNALEGRKLRMQFKVRPQRRTFTLRSRHLTHAIDTRFFSGFPLEAEEVMIASEVKLDMKKNVGVVEMSQKRSD